MIIILPLILKFIFIYFQELASLLFEHPHSFKFKVNQTKSNSQIKSCRAKHLNLFYIRATYFLNLSGLLIVLWCVCVCVRGAEE